MCPKPRETAIRRRRRIDIRPLFNRKDFATVFAALLAVNPWAMWFVGQERWLYLAKDGIEFAIREFIPS